MEASPHLLDSRGLSRRASGARARRSVPVESPIAAEAVSMTLVPQSLPTPTTAVESATSVQAEDAVMFEPRARSELVNRVVNVAVASVALVLLAPLMLLVALAIRLTSRGPIFYTQTRVGIDRRKIRQNAAYDRRMQDLGGEIFAIYKFRTMFVDAEHGTGAVWATKRDPRVTPVGRVLRASRIDELPQLWNVLLGDMNIVGPRPERPSIFARLREDIADYPLRQRTKPGITGWAQINHSYDACLDDVRVKVRFDLEYLQRQGLAEDVKIMLKTLPVMIFKRSGW